MSALLHRLDAIDAAVHAGEEADPDELVEICAALREDPDQIPRDDAKRVVSQLHRLSAWAADQRDDIAEELAKLGEGRRAMRGYSSLQGDRTAQKLFRRA